MKRKTKLLSEENTEKIILDLMGRFLKQDPVKLINLNTKFSVYHKAL